MSSHAQRTTSLRIEALARELFERAGHDDNFDDLKRRVEERAWGPSGRGTWSRTAGSHQG